MKAALTIVACTVCMGAPGDPLVEGANRGIWVLLGIIFLVQVGFVALFWSFWKRAKALKKFREQFRVIEGGPLRVYPERSEGSVEQLATEPVHAGPSRPRTWLHRSLAALGINFIGGSR